MTDTPMSPPTVCLLLLVALLVPASLPAAVFPERPPDAHFWVDEAGLLDEEARAEVDRLAGALLAEMRVPMYVATIRSLAAQDAVEFSIERYAQALFDAWGIGWQDRNVGMLLLVSRDDRKARIEFGADLGSLYDADAEKIMQKLILPAFRRGEFSTGIVDGVRGLERVARGLDLPRATPPAWFWPAAIAAAVGVVALLVSLFRSGRSGWAWALIAALAVLLFMLLRSGGSSGSSGGFGGGSSGGGGATGSW